STTASFPYIWLLYCNEGEGMNLPISSASHFSSTAAMVASSATIILGQSRWKSSHALVLRVPSKPRQQNVLPGCATEGRSNRKLSLLGSRLLQNRHSATGKLSGLTLYSTYRIILMLSIPATCSQMRSCNSFM